MSRQNIVFVTLNAGRGSRSVVEEQIKAFSADGYNAVLISTQPHKYNIHVPTYTVDIGNRPLPIHDFLPDHPDTIPAYDLKPDEANFYIQRFKDVIEEVTGQLDGETVLFVHHANIHTIATHEIARAKGIQYLIEPHGTCIGGYQKSGKILEKQKGLPDGQVWGRIQTALEEAYHLIAISDYIKETQIRPYVDHNRITTVYNPIDFSSLADINPELVPNLIEEGFMADLPYILSIGVLKEWKGTLDLMNASHLLPDGFQVVFIGADSENLGTRIVHEGKNCIYLGPKYGADRNALINSALAVTVASLEEPFGLTLPEANGIGKMVIARPGGAMTELVQHGITGFLAEDSSIIAYGNALNRGIELAHTFSSEKLKEYAYEGFGPHNIKQLVDIADSAIKVNVETRTDSTSLNNV